MARPAITASPRFASRVACCRPEFLLSVARGEAGHQEPADYGLTRSLALRDEIGRAFRIAVDLWTDFRGRPELDTHRRRRPLARSASSVRRSALRGLARRETPLQLDGRRFPITHDGSGRRRTAGAGCRPPSASTARLPLRRRGPQAPPHRPRSGAAQRSRMSACGASSPMAARCASCAPTPTSRGPPGSSSTSSASSRTASSRLRRLLAACPRLPPRAARGRQPAELHPRALAQAAAADRRARPRRAAQGRGAGAPHLRPRASSATPPTTPCAQGLADGRLYGRGPQPAAPPPRLPLIFLLVAEDRDLLHPPGTADEARRL